MKITALTIENFKGVSNPVRVEFKPITLLFGPNSAGKSTIIQALHYIREILERGNVDADQCLGADESLNLGGFANLVHNHDLDKRIRFKIEMDHGDLTLPDYPAMLGGYEDYETELCGAHRLEVNFDLGDWVEIASAWVELEVGWSHVLDKPLLTSYATGFNGEPLACITCADDGKRVRISKLALRHPSLVEVLKVASEWDILDDLYQHVINTSVVGQGDDINLMLENQPSVLPHWGKALAVPPECFAPPSDDKFFKSDALELLSYLSQLIVGPGELLLNEFKKGRYIGPIRKTPSRHFSAVRSLDESRWASGLAAWDILYKADEPFIKEVSAWLSREDRLNAGYSLELNRFKKLDVAGPLYRSLISGDFLDEDIVSQVAALPEERRLVLVDEKRQLEVLPQDIGIGISQILPVVVGALDKGIGVFMVEQPELHIHPALQVNLGDLFISAAENSGAKMFVIETHSEHLLLRLLKRIRQTSEDDLPPGTPPLTPEQVSVNYIEHTPAGLAVRKLLISEDGDSLGQWPKGFFEERAEELL